MVIVRGNVVASLEHPCTNADGGQSIASGCKDWLWSWWLVSCRNHVQHFPLCLREEMITVEHDPVGRYKEVHATRFLGACGDLRLSHLQEGALERSKRLGILGPHHRVDNAAQHFLGSPTRRDDTCSQFHETDICFSRRHNPRSVHCNLTPAAQGKTSGGYNNRFRRIAHPHVEVLQFAYCRIQHIPHALLCADHHHEQICAS